MDKIIYLDNAATTAVSSEVVYSMLPYMIEQYGNPSTSYSLGREAREVVENCRNRIANILNCDPTGLYFTSGGTESDNTLIKGIAHCYYKKDNIIVSNIEHPAVLQTCKELEKEGFTITYAPVKRDGLIDIKELEKLITPQTKLISIMLANNELGTIEPLEEICVMAHKHKVLVHTDMVQATGHMLIDIQKLGVDSFSCSGHKFGAPKGIGLAYIRPGAKCKPFIVGGGQEQGFRSGTENVPAIVGMTVALEKATKNMTYYINRMNTLRELFLKELSGVKYKINGSQKYVLPGTLNISFPRVDGENLKLYLDSKGICVSNGSACHSGSVEPSHVLKAIKLSDNYINGTIRISFGDNTEKDIQYVAQCIKEYLKEIK